MNEGQVSIDGVTRDLDRPFMVLATQNNRYSSGTFPLPEPQLDRFLVSINMRLPDIDVQTRILMLHAEGDPEEGGGPIMAADELRRLQEEVAGMPVSENVCRYISHLCEAARHHKSLGGSLSARASIALMRAAQAVAYLENHAAVHPDDIKRIAIPVLQHRLAGREAGSAKGIRVALEDVLLNTPVT
jgi:MoxR-like ATPase